jgi:hypothetical protein
MRQQARNERLADLGQLERIGRVVERVAIALEQRQVRVHRGARLVSERLRHKGRVDALLERHLLDDKTHRHQVVSRREGVGVAKIDLLLSWGNLVVAELDADPHPLQHRDRLSAEVVPEVVRRLVEIATGVDRLRQHQVGSGPFAQEEELDLRVHIERESQIRSLLHDATQHVPRIGVRRRPVRHEDVAEHARRTRRLTAPRQHLERRRIGPREHVRLVHASEAFDGGAVEADALRECTLELGRCDGDRLEKAEYVCEPKPDEADVPLLDRAQDELLLPLHVISLRRSGYIAVSPTHRRRQDTCRIATSSSSGRPLPTTASAPDSSAASRTAQESSEV